MLSEDQWLQAFIILLSGMGLLCMSLVFMHVYKMHRGHRRKLAALFAYLAEGRATALKCEGRSITGVYQGLRFEVRLHADGKGHYLGMGIRFYTTPPSSRRSSLVALSFAPEGEVVPVEAGYYWQMRFVDLMDDEVFLRKITAVMDEMAEKARQ